MGQVDPSVLLSEGVLIPIYGKGGIIRSLGKTRKTPNKNVWVRQELPRKHGILGNLRKEFRKRKIYGEESSRCTVHGLQFTVYSLAATGHRPKVGRGARRRTYSISLRNRKRFASSQLIIQSSLTRPPTNLRSVPGRG